MAIVYIDGIEYQADPCKNMLQVVMDNELELPYFCWHPAMGSAGACRICAVRVFKCDTDTIGKVEMACMTPARDGTRISVKDPEAIELRRHVIEWLMTNHPHDCPVCDEGGECHLQDMTALTGHVYRRYRGRKRTYNNQDLGPFVNHEMNRCIQCYRCVRFYRDFAGGRDFNVFGSKNRVYFGREEDGVLESEFSGNLVEVCPTGVFTDKTLKRHYTRKWDLETAPSVCIHCGLGCNTIPGARYGQLRRIRARYNSDINGYFLCDRGRYGYEFVNDDRRIRNCRSDTGDRSTIVAWDDALEQTRTILRQAKGVVGIGSPRASLEANYALKKLVGDGNYSTGLSEYDQAGAEVALRILREVPVRTPSLVEIESADGILVLGADPTNEAPMMDFAIRQAMRKSRTDISRNLGIPDWDAGAVKTALQDAKGRLYIASPWRTKLEEIAAESQYASFPDIARLASEMIAYLKDGRPSSNGFVSRAAADLLNSNQPLVVVSISAGTEVLRTAAELSWTLHGMGKNCRLSVIVPEANTLGVSMLGGMSVPDALRRLESGEADTLIVLENDLSRRAGSAAVEKSLGAAGKVIALDCIETAITDRAEVVLPAAAWVECDGTFVNNEGRAQRFYQMFIPPGEPRAAWEVLRDLGANLDWAIQEDVLGRLAEERPEFAPALEAAPSHDWRSEAGRKIARRPHRFSGRTAMEADKTLFETQTPPDPQTPFAFTTEGDQNPVPGPLVPRFWWPGWNSDNSVTRFQTEVNGPLQGGNSGRRLIEPSGARTELSHEPTLPASGTQCETETTTETCHSELPRGICCGGAPSPGGEADRVPSCDSLSATGADPSRELGMTVDEVWLRSKAIPYPDAMVSHESAEPLQQGDVWLIPRPYIFGSDEFSRLSEGIAQLTPSADISIHPGLAEKLGVSEGEYMEIEAGGRMFRLPVRFDNSLPVDVATVPANLDGTVGIFAPVKMTSM